MWQASEAFGFLDVDDLCSLYGGPHGYYGDVLDDMGDHPDVDGWGEQCGGHLPPCMIPADFRKWAASAVSDERAALMAELPAPPTRTEHRAIEQLELFPAA